MARRALLVALLLCVAAAPLRAAAQGNPPRRGKWWQAEDVQRELGLTPAQVDAIEKVFQDNLQERIRLRRDVDELEAKLKEMLERADADDAHAEKLIAQVEEAHLRRNTARTLMLLRMYRVLTPEQRTNLRKVLANRPPPAAP